MPAKNSTLRYPNREHAFGEDFYKDFVEKTQSTLSFLQVKEIVHTHTKNIAEVIEDDLGGFKLPNNLGVICAIKYKVSKPKIDWNASHKLKKKVYFTNVGTRGYTAIVKLFTLGWHKKSVLYNAYMFRSCKKLNQSVSNAFKNGKNYDHLVNSDFLDKSKLSQLQKRIKSFE